jgi:hypothetical protein
VIDLEAIRAEISDFAVHCEPDDGKGRDKGPLTGVRLPRVTWRLVNRAVALLAYAKWLEAEVVGAEMDEPGDRDIDLGRERLRRNFHV